MCDRGKKEEYVLDQTWLLSVQPGSRCYRVALNSLSIYIKDKVSTEEQFSSEESGWDGLHVQFVFWSVYESFNLVQACGKSSSCDRFEP